MGLLRLNEIDMQCLLLVCGKINVLFMLIFFIMRLVESEMELDLDAQKRQQYNRHAVQQESEANFLVELIEASEHECPSRHHGSAHNSCVLHYGLLGVSTTYESDGQGYDDVH